MSSEVQTNPVNTLRSLLEKAGPKLAEVAPKHLSVDRLIRLLLAAAGKNSKILECSQESVLRFAMTCSQTGLEPIGPGGAWPIPYGRELQFVPDYRGLVNCAKRAGCIKDAYAEIVREKDDFDYALGMDPYLTHKPARGDRGGLESAYCIIVFPDDTKRFVVMDGEEVNGIRKRSKAANAGPWVTDESEMWKKTVVRRAMKPFAGASPELDAAIQADNLATGAIDITPREEIRMPQAKAKPSAGGTASGLSQEPTDTPAGVPPESSDPAGPPPPVAETKHDALRVALADASIKQTDFVEGLRAIDPKGVPKTAKLVADLSEEVIDTVNNDGLDSIVTTIEARLKRTIRG